MTDDDRSDATAAPRCEITVRGHLADHWSAWFEGLELTRTTDGTTVISGSIADQSALHGLLQKLRDLGIPLISLTATPAHDTTQPASNPGSNPERT